MKRSVGYSVQSIEPNSYLTQIDLSTDDRVDREDSTPQLR